MQWTYFHKASEIVRRPAVGWSDWLGLCFISCGDIEEKCLPIGSDHFQSALWVDALDAAPIIVQPHRALQNAVIWEKISDSDLSYLSAFAPEREENEVVGVIGRNEVQAIILCDEMLAIVRNEHRAMPIWKSPENLVLFSVFDMRARFGVGNSADLAVRTCRGDSARRRQRRVASGGADRLRDRDAGEYERAHRPNENKLSYRYRERVRLEVKVV